MSIHIKKLESFASRCVFITPTIPQKLNAAVKTGDGNSQTLLKSSIQKEEYWQNVTENDMSQDVTYGVTGPDH